MAHGVLLLMLQLLQQLLAAAGLAAALGPRPVEQLCSADTEKGGAGRRCEMAALSVRRTLTPFLVQPKESTIQGEQPCRMPCVKPVPLLPSIKQGAWLLNADLEG